MREDIVAATVYLPLSVVQQVDALSTLHRRDRREVLGALVVAGLRRVIDRTVVLDMPADMPADIPPADVPRITTLRRVP
ncbi:hypothetical protein [Paraburkholderia unamae]|uniref:Uncharacterized protein n=1 Tax=Paraburkholderia unamae TaxID=219649 RepID=A0ACC6RRQ1_9BURK